MADEPKPAAAAPEGAGAAEGDAAKAAAPAAVAPSGNKLKLLLSSLSPREKTIATITGLFLMFLMIDMIVTRPLNNHLKSLSEQIQEKKAIIPRRLMILRHQDKIKNEQIKFSSYFTSTALSQEEEIAQLLSDIEKVSNESGLFVSNINPVRVEDKGSFYELAVDIDGQGDLEHAMRFVRILEKSNPTVRVATFDFRTKKKDSDEIKYMFTIVKLGLKEV